MGDKPTPHPACSTEGCDRPQRSKGMCKPCYRRDYYRRNKARENANSKAYHEANLDRIKAHKKEQYEAQWGEKRTKREAVKASRIASPEKTCTQCLQVKSKAEFHKDPRRLDGRYSWCKECFSGHLRDVYDSDVAATRQRRWYEERGGREVTAERRRRWCAENPERAREQVRRYQARKLAATIEEVDYGAILERDGMVCHICRGEIATLDGLHFDHVIPLSRGGAHSMANVKPAHATCNLRKNAKLLEELT